MTTTVSPSPFTFCPGCGQRSACVSAREFRCEHCQFRYFHNVAGAVGALVVYAGELLATWRNREPAKGTFDIPGGFVEPGESAEQALARELAEELGWQELPGTPRYLCSLPNQYPFAGVVYATIDNFYVIHCAERPRSAPSEEIGAVVWIPRREIALVEFGFQSVRSVLTRFVDGEF